MKLNFRKLAFITSFVFSIFFLFNLETAKAELIDNTTRSPIQTEDDPYAICDTCGPSNVCIGVSDFTYRCVSRSAISKCGFQEGQNSSTSEEQDRCLINGGAGNAGNAGNSSGQGCSAQFVNAYNQCKNRVGYASLSCNEENSEGLNKVSSTVSQLTAALQQQSASSIQSACSTMGKTLSTANAAISAFTATCDLGIKACKSACSQAADLLAREGNSCTGYEDLEDSRARCNGFTAKTEQISNGMRSAMQSMQQAQACANLTGGGLEALCRANPNMPGCSDQNTTDCSNPANAANPVCMCLSNPADPACSGKAGTAANFSSTAGGSDPISKGNSGPGSLGDLRGGNELQHGEFRSANGQGNYGRQGGGANLAINGGSGGGGGGAPGGGAGGSAAGIKANIYSGFVGGGGRGGGSGPARQVSNEYGRDRALGYSGQGANGGGPDLRKFLPGGQLARTRGVGGVEGPDGITGPHTNIWQKVKNRYRTINPTLLP